MVFFKEIKLNKEVSPFSIKSSLFVGPIQLPIHWVSVTFSSEVKQPELESDYSHPSRARKKMGGGVFTLSMVCLETTLFFVALTIHCSDGCRDSCTLFKMPFIMHHQ
jgi:hypothetical protein